jgi:hypothetical protein
MRCTPPELSTLAPATTRKFLPGRGFNLQDKFWVLEEHQRKARTRDIYQQIREITGKPKTNIGAIRSKTGVKHIEKGNIIKSWKEYAEELYQRDTNVATSFQEITYQQKPLVMESKARKALQGIEGRKARGVDNLPIELIIAVGEPAIMALTTLCQQIRTNNSWPQEWIRSIFLPLPKKGDLRLRSNYRSIALIPHASKILLQIIQDRLATHIEREMAE